MLSVSKFCSGVIAASLWISLSACQPKAEPVKPSAEQFASLNRLHKTCIAASPGKKGDMDHLARLRKKQSRFTCDEMKSLCESDYAHELCQGMIIVASVETAHQKACRSSAKGSVSSACRKLSACNVKGFESPECLSAVKPYNR